jgi:hypothetical protein
MADLTHHDALSRTEHARRHELSEIARQVKQARHEVDLLLIQRDSRIFYWHEDGMSVELLSNAAGLTRQGAYDAIDRFRAQLTE